MLRILLFLFVINLTENSFCQKRAFKELIVDLDQNRIDSILPVEEPFYIKFVSSTAFNLNNYRLLRVRMQKAYFSQKINLYFLNIPLTGPLNSNVGVLTIPKSSKVSISSSVKNTAPAGAVETTTSTITEYPTSPNTTIQFTSTVFVPDLTPNFYYYLITVTSSQAHDIDNGTLSSASLNLFNALERPNTIPLGNTALDASENMYRHVTAIFGFTYVALPNKSIIPCLGLRYNFLPVNKWIRQGMSEMSSQSSSSKYGLDRLALDVGISLQSIEDSPNRVKNLYGSTNLMLGIGYRVANYCYISGGEFLYKKQDDSNVDKTYLGRRFYLSISLDWDFGKTFSSFGKVLGISY